jgi:hypothetical protein
MARYQNSSFDGGQDRLLNAMQYRESVDKRVEAQKNSFRQDMGLILEAQRNDIASAQLNNTLDQQFKKNAAAKAIADFSAVYDPTDTDHRSKLDWYRNWGIGEGMSAQEVGQGFANADNKTAAMDSQLASLRAQSGIQDWETTQTQDGRKIIDVASTISKSNYMKEQLDKEAASWTTSDRQLEGALIKNSGPGSSRADIRAMVNENRRTLEDYKTVVGQELWNPPNDFTAKFVHPVSGGQGVVSADSIGYSPKMYSREALELDKGYLKARGYAVRIASGEEPVFKRDANGNVEYDADNVAKVERWVNPKRENAIAETDKKVAEAQTAQNQAALDAKYGDTAYRARAAAQIQAATSNSYDTATRDAAQAEISALFGGGAAAPAGQNTDGDAGKPISTYKKSK